jgi:hypothetical protein
MGELARTHRNLVGMTLRGAAEITREARRFPADTLREACRELGICRDPLKTGETETEYRVRAWRIIARMAASPIPLQSSAIRWAKRIGIEPLA